MKEVAGRLLLGLAATVAALALVIILIAFSIGYLLDSLAVVLSALMGQASALAVTGLLCALLLLVTLRALTRISSSEKRASAQPHSHHAALLDSSRELIQKYPTESAAIALIAGVAAETPETRELLKTTVKAWLETQSTA
ncbi:hypothetical protein [Litorivivens sp.]|uniref:hypothetical protein n=1 Tax=Litorivivens sp. TaxID=2020868 RepID=UPI0035677534